MKMSEREKCYGTAMWLVPSVSCEVSNDICLREIAKGASID